MPLLTSPIDGSPMRQIKRYGVELDVCPTSGGVWLDKGELDKIVTMIQNAVEEMHEDKKFQEQIRQQVQPQQEVSPQPQVIEKVVYKDAPPHHIQNYHDDYGHKHSRKYDRKYDQYDRDEKYGRKRSKKGRVFSEILDLFDFD